MFEAITPDLIISSPYRVSALKSAALPHRRPTVWDVIFVIMRLLLLEIGAFLRPRLSLSQILVVLVVTSITVEMTTNAAITWLNHRSLDLLMIVLDPLWRGVLC